MSDRPRIPLPEGEGLSPSEAAAMLCPAVSEAFRRSSRAAFSMTGVDPVTVDLVRLRNGQVQGCHY